MSKQKEIAQHFLTLAANGNPKEAFALYVATDFIHHNAYFKGDRQSLIEAMEEAAIKQPNKKFEIQRVLEDGELVAVHSKVVKEDMEIAVVHIIKFENDKIVELWDVGQVVLDEKINENGLF